MLTSQLQRFMGLAAIAALLVCAGCQTAEQAEPTQPPAAAPAATVEEPAEGGDEEIDVVNAARTLGTPSDEPVVTTESGLQYIDVKVGEGEAAVAGDDVSVHYTGWLVNGTKFDSSKDRGRPFAFPLGGGRVIKGWDEGVAGMAPGGIRKLIIPPELGYGPRGAGPIPPNSTLIFEVEFLGTE
jgi:FKBP-type peptidyl-prolyl cis-trans isomerase FkpA